MNSPLSLARTSPSVAPRAPSVAPKKRSIPPGSKPKPEEMRAMFERAEEADQELADAELVKRTCLEARSQIIKDIAEKCGPGPFRYKGQEVRIVNREGLYFFRLISKEEPEEIG